MFYFQPEKIKVINFFKMQYVRKSAHAGAGLAVGAYGVLKMDDMVYT